MNGVDVTQKPVRLRNVSMVYQQFINYPTMTVFENIAVRVCCRTESPGAAGMSCMRKKISNGNNCQLRRQCQ
jgi:ABC-type sugar transport system ATPase subunit